MSLIKLIINVIKVKKSALSAYIINTAILVVFYYLIFNSREVFYPISISLFILMIYLSIEIFGFYKLNNKLNEAKISPEIEVNNSDIEERMIFNSINHIHSDYHNRLYKMKSQYKDRNTLFSQWIHNMKTSITVIDLACEKATLDNSSKDSLQDVIDENRKLKTNLEECLNILRLDDFSRDYIPEKVNLNKIVFAVVNSKKRDFIYRGVYPKVEIDKNIEVLTDKKWCSYMIEQILANAIKYSPKHENKNIYITLRTNKDEIILMIKDEGIGIDTEDVPRVFEPFFTGNNGRNDRSATGIGLYMVKFISQKLNHKVGISSNKGQGTEARISFLSKL